MQQLCHDAGLSLKCTDGKIVIFDQQEYEGKDAVWTTTLGDKSYIKYSHSLGQAGTQYASCRVSYVGPDGKAIEGIAYVKDYDAKSKTNQQLEVYAPVTSKAEAKELAAKVITEKPFECISESAFEEALEFMGKCEKCTAR